jgi:hypothetical protein
MQADGEAVLALAQCWIQPHEPPELLPLFTFILTNSSIFDEA